jgi:hypothetical protein
MFRHAPTEFIGELLKGGFVLMGAFARMALLVIWHNLAWAALLVVVLLAAGLAACSLLKG